MAGRGVGIAVKGVSKILRKGLRKAPVLGKYARGTPTKAGLTARRAALRGETTAEKYGKLLGPPPKPTKKKPIISTIEKGIGIGVTGTLGFQEILKKQKEVKAKEKEKKEKKGKLRKAIEKHEKKTKDKRKKYGKHHG